MTYFCECFICSENKDYHSNICPHREPELIVWWRRLERERTTMARFDARRIAGVIEPPKVVLTPQTKPIKRAKPPVRGIFKQIPLPMVMDRIPARSEDEGIRSYSALRGW